MPKIITPDQWNSRRWPNFTFDEMKCQETGEMALEEAFMDFLQKVRDIRKRMMSVTSGYRSPLHSIEATKEKPGTHSLGVAADIVALYGGEKYEIVEAALEVGFQGIGIGKTFVHLDFPLPGMNAPMRPAIWTY
jgi:uncharacterized protein YcbK (DUF882 family)